MLGPIRAFFRASPRYHLLIVTLFSLLLLTDNVSCDSSNGTFSSEHQLYQTLIKDYETAVRPAENVDDVVRVNVSMILLAVVDLDEHSHTLDVTAWLYKSWIDPRLTWDPKKYNGLDTIRIRTEQLWKPDIVLYNNAGESYDYVMDKLAVVKNTGQVMWVPHARLKAFCNLDLSFFPYDKQTCILTFGSWTYSMKEVDLVFPGPEPKRHVYDGHEWKIVYFNISRTTYGYQQEKKEETYPVIICTISLRRVSTFYSALIVTPSVLLAFLTAFHFFIPPASGERLPFAVGLIIAQTLMMNALMWFVPTEIGDLPVIGVHILMQMIMTTVGIVISIGVLNCHHRGVRKSKVPSCLRQVLTQRLGRLFCVKQDSYAFVPSDGPSPVGGDSGILSGSDGAELHTLDRCDSHTLTGGRSMEATLEEIRKYLRVCAARAADASSATTQATMTSHRELVIQEWHQLALVIDRFMFCLYVILTVITSIVLFGRV